MIKKISFSTKGQNADIGELQIHRILPNRYTDAVGYFVFLDHVFPQVSSPLKNTGTGGHPHRGIATLSYLIEGEGEHFDSAGNHAKVYSGEIQWMKAGKGIIHDETFKVDSKTGADTKHGFQFWINLPSKNKAENPEYLAIQSNDVPQKKLENGNVSIKVILGSYQDLTSIIPSYSEQFLYHIKVEPGKSFIFPVADKIEVAAFLPIKHAIINGFEFQTGEFIEFDRDAGDILIENNLQEVTDVILFGGEPYTEPIVAEGPFVMNSKSEIADAYRDYYSGAYGKIDKHLG